MSDREVREQYEALPYPARDPRDEARRLIIGSPSHLLEIDHYVFGGRRDWSKPFRALFAGGGTGDGAIMLAQQLADRGCPAELVHLDQSVAARQIAEARAARRGLTSLRFVTGSLLDLAALGLGVFDYVDCCGVLHHLDDPAGGLAALAGALAPDGGLGAMVYGRLGRTGVYEMQEILRVVAGEGAPRERVQRARKLLADLPPTNWLARNPNLSDHVEGGDAGLFDLLLHARDRAFSVEEIGALVDGAALRLVTFIEPARYDALTFVRDPGARRAIAGLDALARAAVAEKLTGAMARHVFYVVRRDNPAMPAALDRDDAVPMLRGVDGPSLAKALGTRGVLVAGDGALQLRLPVPLISGAIAARLDDRTSLGELRAALGGLVRSPDLDADIRACCGALNAVNLLLVRYRA
ncbi:MAG TPA: class I SAM-dependent methyltransferase [Candidatus Sulfotelmatobacter sp.]|nr:class I SAM-dependent methyltransferase [Candidatus Sulfotelmatobacter sp.]